MHLHFNDGCYAGNLMLKVVVNVAFRAVTFLIIF